MSFPRYPKYKDSGVEWLGEVPEHWEVKPLKHVAWIDSCGSYGTDPEAAELVLPVATTAQIGSDGRFNVDQMPRRGFSPSEVKRFGCSDGDLLVVKSSGSATNIISGKTGLVDHYTPTFVFSNFLMRVRPMLDRAAPKFIYAQLRSHLTRQRVELMCSTTTYPNLQIGKYSSALLPIPPLPEQTLIASFIDRETAKIDELVAEQRRLMELLKEKRQAVISHAVTRGLNPDVPLKPSGIEWLGDVPKHWDVTPLTHLSESLSYGFTNPMPTSDEGPYMLTANDVDYGKVKYETARRTSCDAYINELTEKSRPKKNDILITKDGTLGRVAIHDGSDACINQSVASLRVRSGIVRADFVATCLLAGTYQDRMIFDAGGTTIKHIYISRLAKMPIAYPGLSEQQDIVRFVNAELAKLDALTAEAQRAIDLLQERRTALISAAVTGQIDVRQLAGEVAA